MFRGLILASSVAVLTACGGGGGGGGIGGVDPANPYTISLRADRTSLPINITGELPGIGVNSPYTTTLYVTARRGNTGDPIPGGEDIFGCNLIPEGLEYGALYYLDGDPEHEVEVEDENGDTITIPAAFRAVTLDANAGGASFHFHSSDKSGTATITCSVFDPQANKNVSTSLQIQVGQATGQVSQVRVNRGAPNFLFAQNTNGTTQLVVQAELLDEAGQRVPDPAAGIDNLHARIIGFGAAGTGALLRSDGSSSSSVFARSINGQAQFTLVSGASIGSLVVEIITDRADNNVGNGVSQQVSNVFSVPVVESVASSDLVITTETALAGAVEAQPYAAVLVAQGGVAPYIWSLAPGAVLPAGLSLSSDGLITGTPTVNGTFRFAARVRDSSTLTLVALQEFSIEIEAAPVVVAPVVINTTSLPDAKIGQSYIALITAGGGVAPYEFSPVNPLGLPAGGGFTLTDTGVLSSANVAAAAGEYQFAVTVEDADGQIVTRLLSLEVVP